MKNNKLPSFLLFVFFVLTACSFNPIDVIPSSAAQETPRLPTKTVVVETEEGPDAENEPVQISGTIPFTSPFFINTFSEPFVLLEDQAGFVNRNREFEFALSSQVIGPVERIDDQTLSYRLTLPEAPQATLLDLDNDTQDDTGVMVFAVAYWSNTWGDPFLEPRDGTGWSTAYSSTITDPERDEEIKGGTLVVWAPDNQQEFPTGFGADNKLFTEDDPVQPISSGYTLVDLDQDPFRFYRERQPELTLTEGEVAVNDYSDMAYEEAFDALFEKASREYPFTEQKNIDWEALYDQFAPRVGEASSPKEFYQAVHDFTLAIPDGHVGVGSFNADVFVPQYGGGVGLVVEELSDGSILVTEVLSGYAGDRSGIEVGAEILSWNGQSAGQRLNAVQPFTGPYSTDHHRRDGQLAFFPRTSPGKSIGVEYQNPGQDPATTTLQTKVEVESLITALEDRDSDPFALPVEGEVLDDSGIGYIQISTFSADYNKMARVWQHYLDSLINNDIPGLIIDLRRNSGGNSQLAFDFAGYFYDKEFVMSRSYYFNDNTNQFEEEEHPTRIEPAPQYYDGKLAVLVGPNCISACEGFAYSLSVNGRATVVGHKPTAGAYGEVGRGQYKLPDDISLQFPTGRTETPEGEILLEGKGVVPDIQVPMTRDSVLGESDPVLQAAVDALQD